MPVPKAAVDQNGCLVLWQDDVGFTRKLLNMEPKAQAPNVQVGADSPFRGRIATPDCRHDSAACGAIESVHGQPRPS